jgi:ABC-2 type transport system permease protein
MREYFVAPVAYIVITIFLFISGYFFYVMVVEFTRLCLFSLQQAQVYRIAPPVMNLNRMVIRPLFFNTGVIVLFFVPAMSMRLLSEEKKTRTIELLMTAPIRPVALILGKYLASWSLFCIMVGTTCIYHIILSIIGEIEWGPVISGYAGLFLLGGALLSMGLFFSSITENQIIAAVVSFVVFLFLWVISWAEGAAGGSIGNVLSQLSLTTHYEAFAKGILDSRDIIFFLSFIVLGIFLTHRSIESSKWSG